MWRTFAIIFTILALILIVLVILLPILRLNDAETECANKSTPEISNTNLWAKFPGDLKSTTTHIFNILGYSDDNKSAKIKEKLTLNEYTEYENFEDIEDKNIIYFDSKSKYSLEAKEGKNEKINTLSLGMFETLETLSNPPEYQESINSINYLLNKAFQNSDSFIRYMFTYYFHKNYIQDEEQVRMNILKNVEKSKADLILSDDEKYIEYSFKSLNGFHQWIKLLNRDDRKYQATWLTELFKLTYDEIESILGNDQYLYNQYLDFNKDLSKKHDCKDQSFCGNEIIYKQLISGEVLTGIENGLTIFSLYNEINPKLYPFSNSPEMNLYFEDYKNNIDAKDIVYNDYKLNDVQLQKLLDINSDLSLLSSNNSVFWLSFIQAKKLDKIQQLYDISENQVKFAYSYFYELLPKLFLYQEFKDTDNKNHTISKIAKAYSSIAENILKKTYYKLNHTNNFYELLYSKYVWVKLNDQLFNSSMQYDYEDICPLIMQHVLDDGKKVLKICSDPVTSFNSPFELLKWYEPYSCIKSGNESLCNMTVINHLRKIVYITEDEIKGIYEKDDLGNIFEECDKSLKDAICGGDKDCTNEHLIKTQFWESYVSKNLPEEFLKSNTISDILPELFPYPVELSYFAEKVGYTDKILEEEVDYLISLTPKEGENILNEDNYEAFYNKVNLEKSFTEYLDGKKNVDEKIYKIINVLSNGFLFNNKINTEYESINNILEGNSNEDENYLTFLSTGEYYENYKPGLNKTTGFNLGLNGDYVEYDRFGINKKDDNDKNQKLRKIITINDLPFLNIKKLDYNFVTNDYSYINTPIYNFQSLEGEKSFIDGFQYNHDEDTIYYYDKISSRPFKFTYSEEIDYEDLNCRKYELDTNDIVDNINEKEDLNSNKAFLSNKVNKPFIVNVGTSGLNINIEDDVSNENYICVETFSNMVVDSKINLVYSLNTKNYGYIYPNIENDKTYPIFIYNRNYKVDIDSFNEAFPDINSAKSFKKYFIIIGVILIVIFALIAAFFFYKSCKHRRGRISLGKGPKENLINDSRDPTTIMKDNDNTLD